VEQGALAVPASDRLRPRQDHQPLRLLRHGTSLNFTPFFSALLAACVPSLHSSTLFTAGYPAASLRSHLIPRDADRVKLTLTSAIFLFVNLMCQQWVHPNETQESRLWGFNY
jgi:hypothetical protein